MSAVQIHLSETTDQLLSVEGVVHAYPTGPTLSGDEPLTAWLGRPTRSLDLPPGLFQFRFTDAGGADGTFRLDLKTAGTGVLIRQSPDPAYDSNSALTRSFDFEVLF